MNKPALILLSLALVSVSHAAVLTVTNTADDGSPGCLRECIALAQPGDEIQFDPSLDGQRVTECASPFVISKNLTITGRGSENTIIAGEAEWCESGIFWISGTVTLSNLTITNGYAVDLFGGPREDGGGIYIEPGGDVTIRDCTISGNTAEGRGGGIYVDHGKVEIVDSRIADNGTWHNPGLGGGVYSLWGTVSIINSTVSGNGAAGGGGLHAEFGTLTMVNSTVSGNRAGGTGGGATLYYLTASIINSTVSGNWSNAAGGLSIARWPYGGTTTIANSVVAGQLRGSDCSYSGPTSLGHNLDSDGSCDFDHPTDISGEDPMLGPLQDNGGPTWTHVPLAGSPVIDRGWCDFGKDQRGVLRPLDGNGDLVWICDIGAVEFSPKAVTWILPGGDVITLPADGED